MLGVTDALLGGESCIEAVLLPPRKNPLFLAIMSRVLLEDLLCFAGAVRASKGKFEVS